MSLEKMNENKTKNTVRSAFWGVLSKLLLPVLSFVNRTVIIYTLGMEYVGLGSLFTSLLQVLSLAELGISEAIVFCMYKPVAQNDIDKVCAILNFYKKSYRIIGLIILAIGSIFLINLDFLISGDVPVEINTKLLFLIYIANSVSSYFLFSYKTPILTVYQRNDIQFKITIFINIVCQIAQFFLLLLLKNYYVYVLITLLGTITTNLLNNAFIRKKYPEFIAKGKIDKLTVDTIKKQTTALMIGKLVIVSRNSFDNLIISMLFGIILIGQYGNYYYIMNLVYGLLVSICAAMRGAIGNHVASLPVMRNYNNMMMFNHLFGWIYGVCSVVLLCVYQPFMKIWVGTKNMMPFSMVMLMVIYFYCLCAFLIISQYSEAAGLYWEHRYRYILESVSNLVMNIVLAKLLGINGVVISTILSVFFVTNIWGSGIILKKYFVGCSKKRFYFEQGRHILVTVLASFAAWYACDFIELDNFFGLLIRAFIAVAVTLVVYLIVYFRTPIFKEAVAFSKNAAKTFIK